MKVEPVMKKVGICSLCDKTTVHDINLDRFFCTNCRFTEKDPKIVK